MSDASEVSEPARAENQAEPNRTVSTRYVAEYVDGPLEGTTEHRYLVDGKPEDRLTQIGLVDRTEAIFWYVAQDSRDVGGVQHVRYAFDAEDSDTLPGASDPDAETREL
jgi:hypothetical protein